MPNQITFTRSIASAIALFTLLLTGCHPPSSTSPSPSSSPATASANAATLSDPAADPAVGKAPETAQPDPAQNVPNQNDLAQGNPPAPTVAPAPQTPAPEAPAPVAAPAPAMESESNGHNEWAYEDRIGPEYGILEAVDAGDSRCYLKLKSSEDGESYTLGATFQVCTEEYLYSVVKLTYERLSSLECPDVADDCSEIAVTQIQPANSNQIVSTSYVGQEWNLTVSAFEPWSGVQGTGNFTIKGFHREGEILDLGGGDMACDLGSCTTTWQDGNLRYALIEEISQADRVNNGPAETARLLTFVGHQIGAEDVLEQERFPNP